MQHMKNSANCPMCRSEIESVIIPFNKKLPLVRNHIVYLPCTHIVQNPQDDAKCCGVCHTIIRKKQKIQAKEVILCIFCKLRNAEVVYMPCTHMLSCGNCVQKETQCPYCSFIMTKSILTPVTC